MMKNRILIAGALLAFAQFASASDISVSPVAATNKLRADLSSTASGKGASLVGTTTPGTVQSDLNALNSVTPIFGTIRQDSSGSGWYVINDPAHASKNISAVLLSGKNVEVDYSFTASKVGTFLVGTDETYSAYGITTGATVAANKATISFYKDAICVINLVSGGISAEPFFTGDITATNNGDGTYTITHPASYSASVLPTVTAYSNDAITFLDGPTITPINATTFKLAAYQDLQAYINYTGSAWSINTNAVIAGTLSVAWSTDHLVVTRSPSASSSNSFPELTSRAGGYITRLGSVTASTYEVYFYNSAGTLVTTPDTSMMFYSKSNQKTRVALQGYATMRIPGVQLDANKMYGTTSNFWIYGAMNK